MREILFRGKRVDNGDWIEGSLIDWGNDGSQVYIIPFSKNATSLSLAQWVNSFGIAVIPETVGQFTGLTDKNGKKIFEGDIIRAITLDTGSEQIAVVCFGNFIDENNDDEYIGFYIEFDGIKTTATQLAMEKCKNRIEIIGNIHNNPELL